MYIFLNNNFLNQFVVFCIAFCGLMVYNLFWLGPSLCVVCMCALQHCDLRKWRTFLLTICRCYKIMLGGLGVYKGLSLWYRSDNSKSCTSFLNCRRPGRSPRSQSVLRPCQRNAVFLIWSYPGSNPEFHACTDTNLPSACLVCVLTKGRKALSQDGPSIPM